MTENRFKQGQYEDALQFTRDILSNSYTINDILSNARVIENSKEEKSIDIDSK